MRDVPTGLLLPDTETTDGVEWGVLAEELGYDSAWMVELWGDDALVELGVLAERTDDIALGSAIVNVFSRSPAVLAMAAATVQRRSDGRFTLGTGVSTPKIIKDLHGLDYEQPVRQAHETIEVTAAYLQGDDPSVEYENELISVADFPPLDVDVPVFHAALGPANRRVVGRLADGWIPHNVPFSTLSTAFEEVVGAARERNRDPEAITVAPYVPAAVHEDPTVATDAVRGHVAYYVGSAKGYERAVATEFPDAAETVAEHWRAGDRAAATNAVTDEMVADLGVAGTPETAPEAFASLLDSVPAIDHPILAVPRQAAEGLVKETVEVLAPGA
jgi:alkanesulfonate monooxygenase SsuD/methylene tetrahydromethanopterin reductase-like flavin-dependent oxidoreductase (luciferase family)